MENQHRKIAGYRDLSPEDIDLMNRVKEASQKLLELQKEVITRLDHTKKNACKPSEIERLNEAEPYRWASIAKTDIQTGAMAMVRAIAQPTKG